jgi:hypothetical protein
MKVQWQVTVYTRSVGRSLHYKRHSGPLLTALEDTQQKNVDLSGAGYGRIAVSCSNWSLCFYY